MTEAAGGTPRVAIELCLELQRKLPTVLSQPRETTVSIAPRRSVLEILTLLTLNHNQ